MYPSTANPRKSRTASARRTSHSVRARSPPGDESSACRDGCSFTATGDVAATGGGAGAGREFGRGGGNVSVSSFQQARPDSRGCRRAPEPESRRQCPQAMKGGTTEYTKVTECDPSSNRETGESCEMTNGISFLSRNSWFTPRLLAVAASTPLQVPLSCSSSLFRDFRVFRGSPAFWTSWPCK